MTADIAMAQTLLAVLLVLAGSYALPDLSRLRDFSWLKRTLGAWTRPADGSAQPRLAAAWLPLLIFALCSMVQFALEHVLFGLPAFAFGVAVLFYCWGPRDLDTDIDAVLKAPDSDRRHRAAQALRPDPAVTTLPLEAGPLVDAAFHCALSRWFGVLFWFVLLGPAGALGYRVVRLLARHAAFTDAIDAGQRALLERAVNVLDWAPAHLQVLTLALVSEFDVVINTWRDYHTTAGRGWFTLDLGFLGVLARAGVDADVIAGDGYAADINDPLAALEDARRVLRRILVAWVVVIAVCVLAGWSF